MPQDSMYPAGVSDNDPHFNLASANDDEPEARELDCGCVEFSNGGVHPCDDDRCELRESEDRCPNRATQTVEEPYTPGRFRIQVCDDCAKSQIEFGYLPVPSPIWSFPELTERENSIITKARIYGYSGFFPCMNGGLRQAQNTLAGAKGFLEGQREAKREAA